MDTLQGVFASVVAQLIIGIAYVGSRVVGRGLFTIYPPKIIYNTHLYVQFVIRSYVQKNEKK